MSFADTLETKDLHEHFAAALRARLCLQQPHDHSGRLPFSFFDSSVSAQHEIGTEAAVFLLTLPEQTADAHSLRRQMRDLLMRSPVESTLDEQRLLVCIVNCICDDRFMRHMQRRFGSLRVCERSTQGVYYTLIRVENRHLVTQRARNRESGAVVHLQIDVEACPADEMTTPAEQSSSASTAVGSHYWLRAMRRRATAAVDQLRQRIVARRSH